MAKIVLGIGCAHTPQIHTAADKWEIRAKRETEDGVPLFYQGEQMKYAEILEKRENMNFAEQMGRTFVVNGWTNVLWRWTV